MAIRDQNLLHMRRRCFRFSYTTILYIVSIVIQISLCSAKPNQESINGNKPEETETGVFKATEELSSSFTTELNFESEKTEDIEVIENEERNEHDGNDKKNTNPSSGEGDEENNYENNCDDEGVYSIKCAVNEPEHPYPQKPFNMFTESKVEHSTSTSTPQPQSTTENQVLIYELHNDSAISTTQADSITDNEKQLHSFISTSKLSEDTFTSTTEEYRDVLTRTAEKSQDVFTSSTKESQNDFISTTEESRDVFIFTTEEPRNVFNLTTEEPHFTMLNFSDYGDGINVKTMVGKASILTNCCFSLLTIPISVYIL